MPGPTKSTWASLLKGAFNVITGAAPREQAATTTAGLAGLFARRIRGFGAAVRDKAMQGVRAVTQALGARDYTDGAPYDPGSSWIKSLTFRPLLYRTEQYGEDAPEELRGRGVPGFAVPDREYGKLRLRLLDQGDLIMATEPNSKNTSGRYTYPNVPRSLMDAWTRAPSAGRFYHSKRGNGPQTYSNRAAILLGRMKRYGVGEMGITSQIKQSKPRKR
jgi:hypothetical protein